MKIQKSSFRLIAGVLLLLFLQVSCTRVRMAVADRKILYAGQALEPPGLQPSAPVAIIHETQTAATDTPAAQLIPAGQPLQKITRKPRNIIPADVSIMRASVAALLPSRKSLQGTNPPVTTKSNPPWTLFIIGIGTILVSFPILIILSALIEGQTTGFGLVILAGIIYTGVVIALIGTIILLRWYNLHWRDYNSNPASRSGELVFLIGALLLLGGAFLLPAAFFIFESEIFMVVTGWMILAGILTGAIGLIIFGIANV